MRRRHNYGAGRNYLMRKGKRLSRKVVTHRGGIRL